MHTEHSCALETLPLGLLRRTFELACTDGGRTGNALSLTSRCIRAAARPSRFHSLHLTAHETHLDSFAALYAREVRLAESGCRSKPRVRHLLLTLPCVDIRTVLALRRQSAPRTLLPSSFFGACAGTSLKPHARGRESYPPSHDAARNLIHTVAPDLWSLAIHWLATYERPMYPNTALLGGPFPLLRELTVHGRCDPKQLIMKDIVDSSLRCFPAMTRLHLLPASRAHALSLSSWFSMAPRISHVRVSGVPHLQNVQELAFVTGLPMALRDPIELPSLAVPDPAHTRLSMPSSGPSPASPYPNLQYIVVQAGAKPKRGGCGNMARARVALKRSLAHLETLCRDTTVKCILLEELRDLPYQDYADQMRRQWIERIEGGAGCWAEAVPVHDESQSESGR
ncbi:hypothetical protein BV20DRAFT_937791 [Pilatotrama ljubarskyi]|nr:hypothetical protein BV20DRAFT_937791 [Pilatotrama ljubarskyi]